MRLVTGTAKPEDDQGYLFVCFASLLTIRTRNGGELLGLEMLNYNNAGTDAERQAKRWNK